MDGAAAPNHKVDLGHFCVLVNLKKLGKAGKRMSRRAPVADEGM
jgi:hypothetical protein